jgi:hypothetical protein
VQAQPVVRPQPPPRQVDETVVRDWQQLEKLVSMHKQPWQWPVSKTSRVRVGQDAVLGKVLVAAAPIDAHEVVLVESPLFIYVKYAELERTARSILYTFSRLDEAKRRFILSFYFCPELSAPGAANAVETYSRVVAGQSDVDRDEAMKVAKKMCCFDFSNFLFSDSSHHARQCASLLWLFQLEPNVVCGAV